LRATQPAERKSPDRWLADFVGRLRRDDLASATVRGIQFKRKGIHRLRVNRIRVGLDNALHESQLARGVTGFEQVEFSYLARDEITRPAGSQLFVQSQSAIEVAGAARINRVNEQPLDFSRVLHVRCDSTKERSLWGPLVNFNSEAQQV
jgi:hypothetical protein